MVGDCTGAGGADEGTARLEVLLQVDEVWEPLVEDWRGAKAGRGGVGRGAVDMVNVCGCGCACGYKYRCSCGWRVGERESWCLVGGTRAQVSINGPLLVSGSLCCSNTLFGRSYARR